MKLRLRDNSVRLRLMRGEVESLLNEGRVECRTQFPGGGTLLYVLDAELGADSPQATFANGCMTVTLPAAAARSWAETAAVSIQGEQALGHGETLQILVEKDFRCLAPRDGEDETDMYPHPQAVREPEEG